MSIESTEGGKGVWEFIVRGRVGDSSWRAFNMQDDGINRGDPTRRQKIFETFRSRDSIYSDMDSAIFAFQLL